MLGFAAFVGGFMLGFWDYIIPTRQMKSNFKLFCIGILVSFGFI